jgi:hypothetical protein
LITFTAILPVSGGSNGRLTVLYSTDRAASSTSAPQLHPGSHPVDELVRLDAILGPRLKGQLVIGLAITTRSICIA